ncbi:MAG TPA: phage tail sheath family protein [Candidatus Methanoperedens sp.]
MPEYLTPGVYIEEFEIGARPIEGVSTSTAGFLGETERGPIKPRVVTSWLEYQRRFGGYFGKDKYLPYAVQGFFENGGSRCFIGRIVKGGDDPLKDLPAVNARKTLTTEDKKDALIAEAIGPGYWGNRVAIQALPGTEDGFKLRIFYTKNDPVEEIDNISLDESSSDHFEKKVNEISNFIKLSLADSGAKPLYAHIGTVEKDPADNKYHNDAIILSNDKKPSAEPDTYKGMWIKVIDEKGKTQKSLITAYDPATRKVTVTWTPEDDRTYKYGMYWILENGSDISGGIGKIDSVNGLVTKLLDGSTLLNAYKGMKIEITAGPGKDQVRTISSYDGLNKEATVNELWKALPDNTSSYRIIPTNSTMTVSDYVRADTDTPGKRAGLTAFSEIDEISNVYAPNAQVVRGLVDTIISHCEIHKDRFAIIDAAKGLEDINTITPRNDRDTQYAAFYYPWLKIIDPDTTSTCLIPPGGPIAGIYARSDTERGVHKAPANEAVRGITGLEFPITKAAQGILNPRGVNVIRAFPGRGILVWGARTLSSNSLWKYINVRRLFIYVEESIEKGTQWVVFEPNNERLWARVVATITQFLTGAWRDGALMGTKPEEAFFVKCDRTTMTQDDIDNGRLICVIGIAPVKPAEFVIFRIAQWAGGSSAKE